jgi:hypothetical protein
VLGPANKFKNNVTPAKAGVQFETLWIPAFAGMAQWKKAFGFSNIFLPNFWDTALGKNACHASVAA